MFDFFTGLMRGLGFDDKNAKRPTLYGLLDESLSPRPTAATMGYKPASVGLDNQVKDIMASPRATAGLPWWRTRTPPAMPAPGYGQGPKRCGEMVPAN